MLDEVGQHAANRVAAQDHDEQARKPDRSR
jgi:hypothetical protein